MKQFNPTLLMFDDPVIKEDGENTEFITHGEGWFLIESQEEIDLISGTITNNGVVWVEDGKVKCSGAAPSDIHKFKDGQWVICEALQSERQASLISAIDLKAANIYQIWTRYSEEYKEREAAALAFKEADYQGEVSIYIRGFAIPAGIDNKTATDLILQQAEGLRHLQEQLAVQRMRKYELKNNDLTIEQMQTIYEDIIAKMNTLAEAYK